MLQQLASRDSLHQITILAGVSNGIRVWHNYVFPTFSAEKARVLHGGCGGVVMSLSSL